MPPSQTRSLRCMHFVQGTCKHLRDILLQAPRAILSCNTAGSDRYADLSPSCLVSAHVSTFPFSRATMEVSVYIYDHGGVCFPCCLSSFLPVCTFNPHVYMYISIPLNTKSRYILIHIKM